MRCKKNTKYEVVVHQPKGFNLVSQLYEKHALKFI